MDPQSIPSKHAWLIVFVLVLSAIAAVFNRGHTFLPWGAKRDIDAAQRQDVREDSRGSDATAPESGSVNTKPRYPVMFWSGLIFTVFWVLAFLLKTSVVWDVSRTNFDGNVPTADYPVFFPVFISCGVSALLASLRMTPFPFFGVVLWLFLVALTVFLMWLFNRLGAPLREAELKANPNRSDARTDEHNSGD